MATRQLLIAIALILLVGTVRTYADPSDNPQLVRQELEAILADPQYNRNYQPRSDWSQAIANAIASFLDLFVVENSSLGEALSFIGAVAIIVAFIVLVALLLRKFTDAGSSLPDSSDESASTDLPRSRALIKEAEALAAQGNYRAAFGYAYLATVSYLDEIQAIRYERSRTNWEYLRELRAVGHNRLFDLLKPLTALYDKKIYGGEECREPDYRMALQAYTTITTEAAA